MIYTHAPEVVAICRAAFPACTKCRQVKVQAITFPMQLASNWDGGSRNDYVIVDLATQRVASVPENGTIARRVMVLSTLPDGYAVIEHSFSQGHDLGCTVHVLPQNLNALAITQRVALSDNERIVLVYTRAIIPKERFSEANRETHIAEADWLIAKHDLIERGFLNRAGAITEAGKNAVSGQMTSDLAFK